ncbi:Programmed cell death protein 4 [Armadillidium nasatum]|uniref:Programmed cell death protein 4 n=1 Tax=Armadillidium nasatum TaxID=96803 RepID=A0A5N5TK70_9CRUS|nr:Programmed cell death protein 4 [Armadillidium nasatum]
MQCKSHAIMQYQALDTESNATITQPVEKNVKGDLVKSFMLKKVTVIVLEYFDHGDTDEVMLSLEELKLIASRHVVIITAIEVAMDHKPSHREMTSVLLADLYGNTLSEEDYELAYDHLLNNLNDLILDTPDAPTILGNFIARSIADDCIPPKFLHGYKGKISCEHAVKALSRAEGLLSMRHGLVRLDNVWGVGGGTRPVKHLIKKMILLLDEYLSSSDIKEATQCLQELEVPHFHHELVYEAVNMVLERMNERTTKMICTLLTSLCNAIIITPNQMKEGFLRIYEDMPQICLDVPPAYSILEKFVCFCQEAKILEDDVVKKMPTRGRKRLSLPN